MDGSRSVDPLEELRRANPVDADDLPSASLARVRASVMGEHIQEDHRETRRRRRPVVRPLALGLAGLAAAVAVAVGALQLGIAPGGVPGETGGPQIGFCVEAYSLESLANRTFAFDGTVMTVDGDAVTFKVHAALKGVGDGDVAVTASGMTGGSITPNAGVTLVPGERFLVSGDGGFAWSCGFTRLYDPATAADWAAALRP
jgi:hypothetical protein